MRLLIFALLILGLVSAAYADDGYVAGYSGSVKLMKPEHPNIQMVREHVYIDIHEDKAKVTCQFIFRNYGKATKVRMGFPEHIVNTSTEDYCPEKGLITNFKSWVDGKSIRTRYIKPKHIDMNSHQYDGIGDNEYQGWYIKDVDFKAGQTHIIVDKYISYIPINYYETDMWFRYILTTGSSWKGKIDDAVISVDTSHVKPGFRRYTFTPAGYKRKGNIYTWHLKNLEPKEDIVLDFTSVPRINGCIIDTDNYSDLLKDHIFVPTYGLDGLIPSIGITATWDNHSKKCTLHLKRYGNEKNKIAWKSNVQLTPNSRKAILDGRKVLWLKQAPKLSNNDCFTVPIASLVRALGGKVVYHYDTMHIDMSLPVKKTLVKRF